jgi:hypothetical protein
MADAAQGGIIASDAESTGDGSGSEASLARHGDCRPHRCRQRWPSRAAPPSRAGRQPVRRVRHGQGLLRVRFDPLDRSRLAATEPLLQAVAGPLVAIAAGPDGAIYFATADSVWRLVLAPTR